MNITMIHLRLLLTHNAKLDKFINWKEVRNTKGCLVEEFE